MKKRLLSMLMAVLMIASLVPATALAAGVADHAKHDTTTIVSIKMNAAAKQPGIDVIYCNTCKNYVATVTPFAEQADIQTCSHRWHVEVLQKATCQQEGLSVKYCEKCGTAATENGGLTVAEREDHVYTDFQVVTKPTCQKNGWGYVLCDNCKNPVFVAGPKGAVDLLAKDATNATKEAVKALYAATNKGHKNTDLLVTATETVYKEDGTVKYNGTVKTGTHADEMTGVTSKDKTQLQGLWKSAIVKGQDGKAHFGGTWYGADSKEWGIVEQTGDTYCPDCGDIVTKNVVKGNLWTQHIRYISLVEGGNGYYPYVDDQGNKHDGRTDSLYCSKCNEYFGGTVLPYDEYVDLETVTTVGQTWTAPAVAATCCTEGKTAETWTYAEVNGEAQWVCTSPAQTIAKLAHNYVPAEDKAATCTENGVHYLDYYVCTNTWKDANGQTVKCPSTVGNKDNQVTTLPKGHNYQLKNVVAATCSAQGLAVSYCTVCGAYELKAGQGANGAEPVYKMIPVVPHTAAAELKDAKEATCTEVGYTGDKVCKWCGTMLEKGKEIPMKEHTSVEVKAVEATCTTDGMTAGTKCSVCDKVLTGCEVVKALGHDYKDGKCTRCGEKDPNYVAPEFKDAASIRDYAKDAVAWAAKEGIVKGDDNGNFLPTADITRQDFVTMLWRLKGSVASEKALTFGDKADIKDYAQTAVAWAVENGYIKGRDNGNFDPAAKITRAEIVAILNRIAENAKAEKAADFTDIATHWAKDAIAWAAEAGIVNGVGNNMFAPNDNASRQDTVVMLYKFVNLK